MATLILVALLCGIFSPIGNQTQQEQVETPPEIRIGDVAKIAAIDEVKDADAPPGTYIKTDTGWAFIPDTSNSADGDTPQNPPVTASMKTQPMTDELVETVGGTLILVVLGAAAWKISGIGKKKGKTHTGDGVSQMELQTLMRRLNTVAQIMESVTPDGNGAKAVERGRRKTR